MRQAGQELRRGRSPWLPLWIAWRESSWSPASGARYKRPGAGRKTPRLQQAQAWVFIAIWSPWIIGELHQGADVALVRAHSGLLGAKLNSMRQ